MEAKLPHKTDLSTPYNIREALSAFDTGTVQAYQNNIQKPDLSHIPGRSGLPLVGNAIPMVINLHKWTNRQHANYGRVFRVKIPTLDGVMLLGPDANRLVFQNENKNFSNYLAWEHSFRHLFDNSLLGRDFSDHKALRKSLQVAFKREAIEGHIELMNPILKQGIDAWPKNQTIRAMDYVKELLLCAGSNVFLGVEPGSDTQQINQWFVDLVSATADLLRWKSLWFSPYAKGIKARKNLSEFILKNIPEHRKNKTRDLLSQFCQLKNHKGNMFSDSEVRDQILFILFAAHDTTTSALSAVFYALASNQQWQNELRQETLALDKEEIEFEDLEKLKKTDWTIKEALRMYPALTMMPRYSLEEFEFEGVRIPANTPIVVSSLFTHYMPEYWSNPQQFDPFRFSPNRAEDKKDFFQYIPFGGGAHKCLGLHFAQVQAKMALFYILKNHRITKHPNMKKYKYNSLPLTFPTDGLPLTFVNI